jgi:hypothetical protein
VIKSWNGFIDSAPQSMPSSMSAGMKYSFVTRTTYFLVIFEFSTNLLLGEWDLHPHPEPWGEPTLLAPFVSYSDFPTSIP